MKLLILWSIMSWAALTRIVLLKLKKNSNYGYLKRRMRNMSKDELFAEFQKSLARVFSANSKDLDEYESDIYKQNYADFYRKFCSSGSSSDTMCYTLDIDEAEDMTFIFAMQGLIDDMAKIFTALVSKKKVIVLVKIGKKIMQYDYMEGVMVEFKNHKQMEEAGAIIA